MTREISALALLAFTIQWHLSIDDQEFLISAGILLFGWVVSVLLTDKYRHKYPQRYFSYLFASHGKAAVLMALSLALTMLVFPLGNSVRLEAGIIWRAYLSFTLLDLLLALLIRLPRPMVNSAISDRPTVATPVAESLEEIDAIAVLQQLQHGGRAGVHDFVKGALGSGRSGNDLVTILNALSPDGHSNGRRPAALVLLSEPVNHVKRLNILLQYATESAAMGGYFVFRYVPLEDALDELRRTKHGLGYYLAYAWHFIRYRAVPKIPVLEKIYFSNSFRWLDNLVYAQTKETRRVISRAEMWGRIYYQGFEVLAEQRYGSEHMVLARRVRAPESSRKPSFFLIVGLTKVGLGGQLIRLHKIRTMYPFSEFIQARIFEDHGLSATGKFKNDFRLTDYGKFLRKYWLDEIPQIYDWLRGEIKLVGMRATSPHFLGLYPKELYDLYVQIKPGLVPPIFDASTNGFDDIVKIELAYLQAYMKHPVRTDIRCFIRTFNDIVFRGVRSK